MIPSVFKRLKILKFVKRKLVPMWRFLTIFTYIAFSLPVPSQPHTIEQLPTDIVGKISEFLDFSDSKKFLSQLKYKHLPLNPLRRSLLNPATHHGFKDIFHTMYIISKAPDDQLKDLLEALLKNPKLSGYSKQDLMLAAAITANLKFLDLLANRLHVSSMDYIYNLSFAVGSFGNIPTIKEFFEDERVQGIKDDVGKMILKGACYFGDMDAVKWLVTQIDASVYGTELIKICLKAGYYDLALFLTQYGPISVRVEPYIADRVLEIQPLHLLFFSFATTLTGHKDILFSLETKLPFHQILKHYRKSKILTFGKFHTLNKPILLPEFKEHAAFINSLGSKAIRNQEIKSDVKKVDSKLADVVYGSIAGIVGKIIEYPFDTVKTRLQIQPLHGEEVFAGPLDCIKQGFQKEGIRGFYKGLTAPLVGSMFENSVLFVSYGRIQDMIRKYSGQAQNESLSMKQLCTAGFLSGGAVSFVLTPVELIKCKLQANTSQASYKGPISVIYHTLRHNGIFGLYRGHMSTFLREAVGGAAWFGTYEYANSVFMKQSGVNSKEELSTWQMMVAGALSGIAYNASLFPVDTIKSREQAFDTKDTFSKIARDIYKAEGIKGFYRGFGITLARSAPSSAIIFATYEWLTRNVRIEY